MARAGWADATYIQHAGQVLSAQRPMSIAMWVKPSTNTDTIASYTHWLWKNEALVSASQSPLLGFAIKSGGTVLNLYSVGATPQNTSSSSYTASTGWYHVGLSWNTDDAVVFYKDGASLSSGSQPLGSGTPDGNPSVIGALRVANIIAQCSIAEIGVWNVILTAAEFAALGKGYVPGLIRPASLLSWVPMVRGMGDYKAGVTTATGSPTVTDHPPVRYSHSRRTRWAPGAAAGGFQPAWAARVNTFHGVLSHA